MTLYSNRRNRLQSDSQAVEYTSLTYLKSTFGKFGWLMTHGTVGRIIPNLLTLVENTMGMETMEAVD